MERDGGETARTKYKKNKGNKKGLDPRQTAKRQRVAEAPQDEGRRG